MFKAFTNAIIFTGKEFLTGKILLVEGDTIKSVSEGSDIPMGAEVHDCSGSVLAPGLIDLQIAGAGGYLFSSFPTPEALDSITRSIIASGTTGYLITLPTNTMEVYRKAFKAVKKYSDPALLGLHLEGPYISPSRRGAHVKEYIKVPAPEDVKALVEEAEGTLRMMTIAPEICSREIIDILNENGIIIAAGHSNATFSEARDGFLKGIRTTTHLFNAMSQLHHRDPGLPGAVFRSDIAFASIIADGIHVDYNTLIIAKKLMGDRLFLVSDTVENNLTGAYQHIRQTDRYTLPDGTLSGSLLTMLTAVSNCVFNAGISREEALRMATLYPSALMRMSDRGRIEPGSRADFIEISNDFELLNVFIGGKKFQQPDI